MSFIAPMAIAIFYSKIKNKRCIGQNKKNNNLINLILWKKKLLKVLGTVLMKTH